MVPSTLQWLGVASAAPDPDVAAVKTADASVTAPLGSPIDDAGMERSGH
jgi:hypothetical protein